MNNEFNRNLSVATMMGLVEKITYDLKEIILSVDSVNKAVINLEELTKGMSTLEIILNSDKLAEKINEKAKSFAQDKIQSPEEKELIVSLMQSTLELSNIYTDNKVPTIRNMSSLLIRLQVDLDEFSKVFKNDKSAKMPDKDFYADLLSLLNLRILLQK